MYFDYYFWTCDNFGSFSTFLIYKWFFEADSFASSVKNESVLYKWYAPYIPNGFTNANGRATEEATFVDRSLLLLLLLLLFI